MKRYVEVIETSLLLRIYNGHLCNLPNKNGFSEIVRFETLCD